MTKKELQKISLMYRTLSSQLLKINSLDEMYCIKRYYDFINNDEFLLNYIKKCQTSNYDFKEIFKQKGWGTVLDLPEKDEELISYGYQLLEYIVDGPEDLYGLCIGYTSSNKFSDNIEAFVRKTIEPFVVALRTYIELSFIDVTDSDELKTDELTTIFLSYCQKDSDVADIVESKLNAKILDKARISRDIRDVEFHQSFKKFMQSIEKHDYVITVISDNYLKSRNCMYEMLEVVKDSDFENRLLFIVLNDDDLQYYKDKSESIAADVYSSIGQAKYIKYWKAMSDQLDKEIDEIGDTTYAITQIKEKKTINKILLDLSDFLEFVRDSKGLPLNIHIKNEFEDMIEFMKM